MKILYVGPYREGTGAAKVGVSLINSLVETGLDLAIRPLKFNSYQASLSPKMQQLENKSTAASNFIIQHVPPSMLVYNSAFEKNIAYVNYHTNNFTYSDWPEKLNMMDEIWVPSNFVANCCKNSKVTKPIKVIPIGFNENLFLENYPAYEQIRQEKHGDFLFYTISSSFSRRKNFAAFVKAFHLEFGRSEPVNIAIKFNKPFNPSDMSDKEFIYQLKKGLNLGETKDEIILPTNYISDNDIYSIHNSCDVFVSTSYGEGWCIPAFEAMGFGRTPIVNGWGGYTDYIDNTTGWLVDYSLEPVFGMENGNLFSGREQWASISVTHLRKCMREAYENRKLREQKSEAGVNKTFEYSYSNIGSLIKKALYE